MSSVNSEVKEYSNVPVYGTQMVEVVSPLTGNQITDDTLANEVKNLIAIRDAVRQGKKIEEFITHEGFDLDNLLAIVLGRKNLNAQQARITHVNANWRGPVPAHAVALDICAGGQGIKGDNSDGVGSVSSLILEYCASAEVQERLENLCNYTDLLDSFGNPAAIIAPTIRRSDKFFLMAVGPNGVMKALLAGYYKQEDVVVRKFSDAIDGMSLPDEQKSEAEKVSFPRFMLTPGEVLQNIRKKLQQGIKLSAIYLKPDMTLDEAFAAYALKKYAGTPATRLAFVSEASGFKIGPTEVGINMPRTARSLQAPGKSIFACVVNALAPQEDCQAFETLMRYAQMTVINENPYEMMLCSESEETREYFSSMDLGAFFRAYKKKYGQRGSQQVMNTMTGICNGMLHTGKAYKKALAELPDVTKFYYGQNIAVVTNPKQKMISRILLDQGVRCVIYVNGHNIGLQRNDGETFELYNDFVKAIIEKTGKEWYRHPTGFLVAFGASTANQTEDSGVSAEELAEAMTQYFKSLR